MARHPCRKRKMKVTGWSARVYTSSWGAQGCASRVALRTLNPRRIKASPDDRDIWPAKSSPELQIREVRAHLGDKDPSERTASTRIQCRRSAQAIQRQFRAAPAERECKRSDNRSYVNPQDDPSVPWTCTTTSPQAIA